MAFFWGMSIGGIVGYFVACLMIVASDNRKGNRHMPKNCFYDDMYDYLKTKFSNAPISLILETVGHIANQMMGAVNDAVCKRDEMWRDVIRRNYRKIR